MINKQLVVWRAQILRRYSGEGNFPNSNLGVLMLVNSNIAV